MNDFSEHWELAYAGGEDAVSWFQADASPSLVRIRAVAEPTAAVIDVGGGSSRLIDGLLVDGFKDLTVLDLSASALALSRARLGASADTVQWLIDDIRSWRPTRRYDIWHDRAVFHFLVDEFDRERYRESLLAALEPGGHLVIATFAEDGPEQCSGLPVRRQSTGEISEWLGEQFEVVVTAREEHSTPSGRIQPFNWVTAYRQDN